MTDPTLTAVLLQLSEHAERFAVLEDREAAHFTTVSDRLDEITGVTGQLGGTLRDQSAILTHLQALDAGIAALAARPGTEGQPAGEREGEGYQPAPAPRWWKLAGPEREEAVARLRAWVEQVYRPGYGQLAAAVGPCWDQHPLCLYALDIAAELWSVLYLQPTRTAALVSAQAEFHTRILPALSEQLITETTRCGHAQSAVGGGVRSWS